MVDTIGNKTTQGNATVTGDVSAVNITATGKGSIPYVAFTPRAGAPTENNSVYIDSTDNNKIKLKDNSGVSGPLGEAFTGSNDQLFGNFIRIGFTSPTSIKNFFDFPETDMHTEVDALSAGSMGSNVLRFGKFIDDFEDGSISAIWTNSVTGGSTITESSGNLIGTDVFGVATLATATLSGTGAPDFKSFAGNSEVHGKWSYNVGSGSSGNQNIVSLQITDGTTTVNLFQQNNVNGGATTPFYIFFDKAAQNVYYSTDGVSYSGPTSISALSTWRIRFSGQHVHNVSGSFGSWSFQVYELVSLIGDGSASTVTFTTRTLNNSSNSAIIAQLIGALRDAGITGQFSKDGGSNWSTLTFDTFNNNGIASSTLKIRFNVTLAGTAPVFATKPNFPRLARFGIIHS